MGLRAFLFLCPGGGVWAVTGEFIRNCNIAKVTAEMTNQEIARLHHHPGFQLWMAAFALLMVLFGVFSLYQKSRKAQRKE